MRRISKERRRPEANGRPEGDSPNWRSNRAAPIKKRTPTFSGWGSTKKGGDILSHRIAVPSAQAGLTSLFGMGRGEPRRNNHLRFLAIGRHIGQELLAMSKYLNTLG